MMPPLVRRCPHCGHLGPARRFARVDGEAVECPSCHRRFKPLDRPVRA